MSSEYMYHVVYYERCSQNIETFDQLEDAEIFIQGFLNKHRDNTDDNWIDIVFYGVQYEVGTRIALEEK